MPANPPDAAERLQRILPAGTLARRTDGGDALVTIRFSSFGDAAAAFDALEELAQIRDASNGDSILGDVTRPRVADVPPDSPLASGTQTAGESLNQAALAPTQGVEPSSSGCPGALDEMEISPEAVKQLDAILAAPSTLKIEPISAKDVPLWEPEPAAERAAELRGEVERLRTRERFSDDQFGEISRAFGGKDARHVTGDGPHTIAEMVRQQVAALHFDIRDTCANLLTDTPEAFAEAMMREPKVLLDQVTALVAAMRGQREEVLAFVRTITRTEVHARDDHSQNCNWCKLERMLLANHEHAVERAESAEQQVAALREEIGRLKGRTIREWKTDGGVQVKEECCRACGSVLASVSGPTA